MGNEKQDQIAGPCTYCGTVYHWRLDCLELRAFVAREKIAVKCTEEIGRMLTDVPPIYEARASDLIFAALEEHTEKLRDDVARMERIAQFLWKLLDDIDTLDDACKDDDRSFRDLTRKRQKLRWKTGAICDGYAVDLRTADVAAQAEDGGEGT